MSSLEIGPTGQRNRQAGATQIDWPVTQSEQTTMKTSLLWHLHPYSAAPVVLRDLFRISVGAFFADLSQAKPEVTLRRDLDLRVHVEDTSVWTGDVLSQLADTLSWLTGDRWSLSVRAAANRRGPHVQTAALVADQVQLLSGGLDSLCGAIDSLRQNVPTLFVGHVDTSTAVQRAQKALLPHVGGIDAYHRHPVSLPSTMRKNRGPRSRSLLFMCLGVLAAGASGATRVVVPENGFTSLNPPLDPGRGGPLTTRSTHPTTFRMLADLLNAIGFGTMNMVNPYEDLTKGELVGLVKTEIVGAWEPAATATLSCAKGGGNYFHGDPNQNCGLCVACVVRRGSFTSAGIADPTPYVVNALSGTDLRDLISARQSDIDSVKWAIEMGIDQDELLAAAIWPRGYDFQKASSLCDRGLRELAGVALP